jgi:hypothetical protein
MMHLTRRAVIAGLTAALAAPAIVKAENLMRLYVPPKPKLLVSSGRLWTKGGKVAGTWAQNADGTIDFRYRNPDLPPNGLPMNGIHHMSGQNNSFERAMRMLSICEVTPYPFQLITA